MKPASEERTRAWAKTRFSIFQVANSGYIITRNAPAARLKLVCRRADQSADNRADCRSSERNPSGIAAAVMDVVNDMMPRWRRRAMRTMPPVMRRGNRRASRQNHTRHENRECLDDLVHITPATFFFDFPQRLRSNVRRTYPFSRLQRVRNLPLNFLTTFHAIPSPGSSSVKR